MAGTSLGDSARTPHTPSGASPHASDRDSDISRTRVLRGMFPVDGRLIHVYASRRSNDPFGVTLSLSREAFHVSLQLNPVQARMLAQFLHSAADTAERAQGGKAAARANRNEGGLA